jgi:ferredoxin
MSIQQHRVRWEQETRLTQWLALGLGALAIGAIVLIPLLWKLRWEVMIAGALLGALVWHLLLQAIEAIHERLRLSNLQQAQNPQGSAGITLLVVLLLALSLSGFAFMEGVTLPWVVGGFSLAAVYAAQKIRETARPRNFVQIANDGTVLTILKGTLLLTALEEAGYRLITQCGRQGQCASCRVRVREGAQNWAEKHYGPVLTPRQRREGWVLACQVPLECDLDLELFKPLVIRWPTKDQTRLSQRARAIRSVLPGFDCEACGYSTCDRYAQAVAHEQVPATRCFPGGALVTQKLQEIIHKGQPGIR